MRCRSGGNSAGAGRTLSELIVAYVKLMTQFFTRHRVCILTVRRLVVLHLQHAMQEREPRAQNHIHECALNAPRVLRITVRWHPYSCPGQFNVHAYKTSHLVTSEAHELSQPVFMFTRPCAPWNRAFQRVVR